MNRSTVHRRAGEAWGLSILLSAAAGLRIVRQDFDQARAQASEAMSLCQELEDPRGIAWSLDVFAGLLAAGGHADGAARLWGASDGLLESVGGSLVPTIGWIRDRYFEPVKSIARWRSIRDGPRRGARDAGRPRDCARASAGASTPVTCSAGGREDKATQCPTRCRRALEEVARSDGLRWLLRLVDRTPRLWSDALGIPGAVRRQARPSFASRGPRRLVRQELL